MAPDRGWFPVQGVGEYREVVSSGWETTDDGTAAAADLPWAQNNYTPHSAPPRALFPELLDCIKGFYEANCSQCGRFFLGRFTLFTGTKVFVWLMSRSAASPGEVQWWTTHGHGSGLGMAGSVRRTRAVTAADSGDQITQNPRPNSRI